MGNPVHGLSPTSDEGTGLLITGTDTSVGKTLVTAAIARIVRRQGQRVRVCKPVATGGEWVGERWLSPDSRLLAEAGEDDPVRVTPWTFAEPLAPAVAARRAGVALNLEQLVVAVRQRLEPEVLLLVEGVGGLLCPLTERDTVADLAAALGFPLVIVTRRSLGTLNHTLLTLEVARQRRLRVAGMVVNETTPVRGIAEDTNVEELRRRCDVPLLAVVPYQTGPATTPPEELAAVDWWQLSRL